MDTPASTRNHLGASNSTVTTPNNVKLTSPNTPGVSTGALGNQIGSYFQQKNSESQTPASTSRQNPVSSARSAAPTARAGAPTPATAAAQAAGEAASGAVSGIQSTWQIGQNAVITNNWFNNVSGVNGIYNGMHDRASMQANAEQRGIDRANNYANTGKAVAGPVGQLTGFFLGKGLSRGLQKDELRNTNFKTMSTTDQEKIDPRDAAISTAREQKPLEDNKTSNEQHVANRNLAYGYGGKPSPPTLDEKESLTPNSEPQPTPARAINHDMIDSQEASQAKNTPDMIKF